MKTLALLLLLAACGSSDDEPARDTDAGVDAPGNDNAPGCTAPDVDAAWLSSLLSDSLTQLTSAPRFTTTQREAARVYLAAQLTDMGWTAQRQNFNNGENVYATIPATVATPGPEIIVGAHFDTVQGSPGASDNASGTVVVLALARYLVDMPCRANPVTIAFFDLEEAGLFGARAMAQSRVPANVLAVHTIDQVGYDSDHDGIFEIEFPTAALEAEWRAAALALSIPVSVTTSQGTDHEAFRDRDYAAVGLSEEYAAGDTSPFRHTPNDLATTVDMTYLANAAKLTAQVILTAITVD